MKSFKEFGITTTTSSFKGDKIKTERLLNREIEVHGFKIEPSTKQQGTECLHLQIMIAGVHYVVFTGAKYLIEDIKKVPKMPFTTTIIRENDWYKFT